MSKTKIKFIKIISIVMSIFLSMVYIPQSAKKVNAYSYNVEAAMAYAAAHWNDGQGECAEFVSRCVKAGGINIGIETFTIDCFEAVERATGITRQDLRLDGNGFATQALDGNILSRGDVVIQWCYTHNVRPHILICSGYDSSGVALFYAHNGALNNGRYRLNLNTAYQHTAACNMGAKVLHISNSDTTPPVVSNVKVSNITANGYDVTCNVSDNVGVTCVRFPTWTTNNGQDDLLWTEGTLSGNTASFHVKRSDHKNEFGLYATDVYAYDAAGNQSKVVYAERVTLVDGKSPMKGTLNGHEYIVTNGSLTAQEAQKMVQDGWHLATITSKEEDMFIVSLINKISSPSGAYWLGANDVKKEGTFVWDTGESFSYNRWPSNQPDNKDGTTGEPENYLGIYSSGIWNDFKEGSKLGYILEKDPHTVCTWDKGRITKSPTCIEKGIRTYTCTVCGKTKTETISTVSHKYVLSTNPATSTNNGSVIERCSICGSIKTRETIPRMDKVIVSYESVNYTGSEIKPSVVVKDINGNVISSEYYDVSYKNNINIGLASVIVTGKIKYSGELKGSFAIVSKQQSTTVQPKNDNATPSSTNNTNTQQKSENMPGVGSISSDGKILTDTEGMMYNVSDKMTKDQLKKNTYVADKKTSGKFKITKVTKKNGKIIGGTAKYMAPYNKNCTVTSIPNAVIIGGVKFKVNELNSNAFKNCKRLKKATIGTNVSKIGSGAFSGCFRLKTVVIKSTVIRSIGSNAFKDIEKKATFTIPKKRNITYPKMIKNAKAPKNIKIKEK